MIMVIWVYVQWFNKNQALLIIYADHVVYLLNLFIYLSNITLYQ